ncbi:NAD-dependent epimerase/dehydratase family protein [Acidobacteria bacterium AH-259-G07]|nr:NAD-dependent epimerase/dehydratase family protein [Acidobacteria bacterium AH-259-G07]
MKQKILVCGATGFIGRNIAERLSNRSDLEVYGTYLKSEPLLDSNIRMIKADLTKKEDVEKAVDGMHVIIQAAATTSGVKDIVNKPHIHVTDNAVMNSLIFRAAFEKKVGHTVFFSCAIMYQSSEVPVKESDFDASARIHSKYFGAGWTKVYLEKIAEFYSTIGNTKYTVIRHSNVYGPYDKFDLERSHVLGATIAKVLTAQDGKIVVWGSGEEERDLLYVSDLVDFVELVVREQKEQFELVNVGYGTSVPIRDLVKRIIQCSERDVRIEYDPSKPSINTRLCLDISKAEEVFSWQPKLSLEEGIRKTIHWYRTNIQSDI